MAKKKSIGAVLTLKDGDFSTRMRAANKNWDSFVKASGRAKKSTDIFERSLQKAGSALSKFKSGVFSLQGIATIALTAAGIDKLGESTVGAAMKFEQQQIAMDHWLKGNKAAAQEATLWLEKFAAATPFEMADLFPAFSRGLGITDGDIKLTERLVSAAADMAALTPGKSVGEAMEALADARTGEFERLKEFNMKISQEEFKSLGGFVGLIGEVEKTYAGGADKLSKSATGLLSTITDNINTYFRKTGEGILTAMKPRLEKITAWFEKNPDTVARWKDDLIRYGNQTAEYVFARLEKAFVYIKTNYLDNPKFKQLTFAGKIDFILDDISQGFNKWLNGGGSEKVRAFGATVGTFIGEGVISVMPGLAKLAAETLINSFVAGLKSSPWGAVIAGALGGAAIGSVVPIVGTGVGALVGGVSGLGTYGVTKGISAIAGNGGQGSALLQGLNSGTGGWRGSGSSASWGSNAAGTDNWRGGLTWVGERGPELIDLPQGSRVYSHAESKNMAAGRTVNLTVNVNGSNLTVREIINQLVPQMELALANAG